MSVETVMVVKPWDDARLRALCRLLFGEPPAEKEKP
jgi:hypothetical protein